MGPPKSRLSVLTGLGYSVSTTAIFGRDSSLRSCFPRPAATRSAVESTQPSKLASSGSRSRKYVATMSDHAKSLMPMVMLTSVRRVVGLARIALTWREKTRSPVPLPAAVAPEQASIVNLTRSWRSRSSGTSCCG